MNGAPQLNNQHFPLIAKTHKSVHFASRSGPWTNNHQLKHQLSFLYPSNHFQIAVEIGLTIANNYWFWRITTSYKTNDEYPHTTCVLCQSYTVPGQVNTCVRPELLSISAYYPVFLMLMTCLMSHYKVTRLGTNHLPLIPRPRDPGLFCTSTDNWSGFCPRLYSLWPEYWPRSLLQRVLSKWHRTN